MKFDIIYNTETDVTSPFNEELFITALKSQLSSQIFKELIQKEKRGIRITVKMEVYSEGD